MTRRLLLLILLALGAVALLRSETSRTQNAQDLPSPWPPRVDETYPDLELIDENGEVFELSSLRGKVLIIEPIGMNCPACLGFSGGHDVGGLGGFQPQQGALALEKYLRGYAPQVSPANPDLVLVQLLLYDLEMGPPQESDARLWADHFPSAFYHRIVAVPKQSLISKASYDLIPGFQLVDRDFVLRSDASGHQPRHSLTEHLFPRLAAALEN